MVKGQYKVIPCLSTPTLSDQLPYQVSTFHTQWFSRYSKRKILSVKVTTGRSKVKSRPHNESADPHSQSMTPPSIKFCTSQFLRYSPDRILKFKVTIARPKVKFRLHYDLVHLHPQPISLRSINILNLTISEI